MPPLDYIHNDFPISAGTQTVQVSSILTQGPWAKEARLRLKELSQLPDNWNGYGSPGIDNRVIEHSYSLLSELARLGMPAPKIVPVSGGGVQFEWRNNSAEMEIEVLPDRTVEYLVVDSAERTYENRLDDANRVAQLLPLVAWFVKEKSDLDELLAYAPTVR